MALVIVNEGQGPQVRELGASRTTVGASADCDVVLSGPATEGCQFVLEATPRGHRVVVLTGDVRLNEQACDVADLAHKDTLRIGESMVLYKNPDAVADPAASSRQGAAVQGEEARLKPLENLEELEGLEELEELTEAEDRGAFDALEPDDERDEETRAPRGPEGMPSGPSDEFGDAIGALDSSEDVAEISEVRALDEIEDLDVECEPQIDEDDAEFDGPLEGPVPAPASAASPRTEATVRQAGPVRFTRPLPPGCQAPRAPPPRHPGRPPA